MQVRFLSRSWDMCSGLLCDAVELVMCVETCGERP